MSSGNEDQIEFWNGAQGINWVANDAHFSRLTEPFTDALFDAADVSSGERVADIGCGCGETAVRLAAIAAEVVGVDVSAPMLDRARERAAGLANVRFVEADAASYAFQPQFDLVFSHFGVMFFADPASAFANLHRALVPDGRIAFACLQAPAENDWLMASAAAVAPFLPQSPPPPPNAPSPFAFADPDRTCALVEAGGFVEVDVKPITSVVWVADDLDDGMRFMTEVNVFLRRAVTELDGPTCSRALSAAREAMAPYATDTGLVMPAAAWLVTAHR